MNRYDRLIIDTNNLYARAFDVCRKNKDDSNPVNQAIQLSMRMIMKLKKNYLEDNGIIYCLADNPTSKIQVRKQVDSSYKSDRPKEGDGYYRGIDYLFLVLQKYSDSFKTLRIKMLEADDLVPEIINLNLEKSILLVSSDLDWARCISDRVDWYNFVKIYTGEIFFSEYKFYPSKHSVTFMKVLLGDKSDSIPAIDGINYQTMLNIIQNFGDVFDLLECCKINTSKKEILSEFVVKTILKNEQRLILNYNLVYFCEVDSTEIKQTIIDGEFNEKALSTLYSALEFDAGFDTRIKRKETKNFVFGFEGIPRK
jgi:5'-3' exonuclease